MDATCYECLSNSYINATTTCESTLCDTSTIQDENGRCLTPIPSCEIYLNGWCIQCEDNMLLNNGKCGDSVAQNCLKVDPLGKCIRCEEKFYLNDKHVCVPCENGCMTCHNSTYCLSCNSTLYLTSGECKTLDYLKGKCEQYIPNVGGCLVCNNSYYPKYPDCISCDIKCSLCNNGDNCISCNSTNYLYASECYPQSQIRGCAVQPTTLGCSQCPDGYFSYQNSCSKCNENCSTCYSLKECLSCSEDHDLISGNCYSKKQIQHCTSVINSKCIKCSFWHSPDDKGHFCETQAEVDKQKVLFEESQDKDGNIPVNKESKELLCIGYSNKQSVKIRYVAKETDKYFISLNPTGITLLNGFACEFEILITPKCSSTINDKINFVVTDMKKGIDDIISVKIEFETTISTYLDYDEILEEKILGEGSFGIVYKGKYRGCDVAIKKMKQMSDIDNGLTEFEKEVSMLDKFRSDYIIHFYGAVNILNKICMVTEYAPFGSLQDVMKHKKSDEIGMKLRIKFCMDTSQGISYLHENGILHRDIKPDNILVFTLKMNEGSQVNGKITDFGSSRNVNMMMTNMTFTACIGTPSYMAPEVLNSGNYKKPADVYSFAITMYECFGWSYAFSKEKFKFPWKIVDFVSKGNYLEKPEKTPQALYEIIQKSWNYIPQNRIEINEIYRLLESQFKQMN
ncbi:receptor tyrosine protein kinase let-23 precursor, putative [Entamoeba invadens IP1]|uniref:Receptor tyrosine protein kinase let-23, putative n=1 Tax=Entamoeba invadens IP1 TaxID=370355 RepID=A0A0A1UGJ8_ENTIV|nr:receptor tyrosine protein kinase let-23 precursor, putative [Entamoeba invadens IP1]ELP92727.1 receptor tyrosine protein kinase let-23 precursor, putative [Entamoeba invadens IP1]|eukprot:XP_004259498.1 receptor tyrosine protein kinase let-23 precursor, putative [Entamoeba invadens IP1]